LRAYGIPYDERWLAQGEALRCVGSAARCARRKGFYERGCQVKTLLLLQEGLVFVGIQPPADELDDFECKGSAVVFPFASVRVESSSELRQAWGRD
jgi:hypothetical protein